MMNNYKIAKGKSFELTDPIETTSEGTTSEIELDVLAVAAYLNTQVSGVIEIHENEDSVISQSVILNDDTINRFDFYSGDQSIDLGDGELLGIGFSRDGDTQQSLTNGGKVLGSYILNDDSWDSIYKLSEYQKDTLDTGLLAQLCRANILTKIDSDSDPNSNSDYIYRDSLSAIDLEVAELAVNGDINSDRRGELRSVVDSQQETLFLNEGEYTTFNDNYNLAKGTRVIGEGDVQNFIGHLISLSHTPKKVISILQPTVSTLNEWKAQLNQTKDRLMAETVIISTNSGFSQPIAISNLTDSPTAVSPTAVITARDAAVFRGLQTELLYNLPLYEERISEYSQRISTLESEINSYKFTIYNDMKSAMNQLTSSESCFKIGADNLGEELRRYYRYVINAVYPAQVDSDDPTSVDMSAIREHMLFSIAGEIRQNSLINFSSSAFKLYATSDYVQPYLDNKGITPVNFRYIISILKGMGIVTQNNMVFNDFNLSDDPLLYTITANGNSWSISEIEDSLQYSYSNIMIDNQNIKDVLTLIQDNKPISINEYGSIKSVIEDSSSSSYFQFDSTGEWSAKIPNIVEDLASIKNKIKTALANSSEFSETRAEFIAGLLIEPVRSVRYTGNNLSESVSLVQTAVTEFNSKEYTEQVAVNAAFANFLDKYSDLYFRGASNWASQEDTNEGVGLAVIMAARHSMGRESLNPLLFHHAEHIIPDIPPISDIHLQTTSVTSLADLLINSVRLQQLQRELVLGSYSVSIALQQIMEKQSENSAKDLIVQAYLHTQNKTVRGNPDPPLFQRT